MLKMHGLGNLGVSGRLGKTEHLKDKGNDSEKPLLHRNFAAVFGYGRLDGGVRTRSKAINIGC